MPEEGEGTINIGISSPLTTVGRWLVLWVLVAALVASAALVAPAALVASANGAAAPEIARPQYQEIVGQETWDGDRTLEYDVVVTKGATLDIKDVTLTVLSADQGQPYPKGLSPKIEIIVEDGGLLFVDSGAAMTATIPGDWYGVVFLPGSLGNITGADIGNGTVGITIHSASPTIARNTIHDMWGDNGPFPGERGEMGAGIVISGTSSAQVISNTITNINGGNGVYGVDGWYGVDGQAGGGGGNAFGIVAERGATPTLLGNTITQVRGGDGGFGGWGGDGADGVTADPDGHNAGDGAGGGSGGNAWGILLEVPETGWEVRDNTVGRVFGGTGGDAGQGGNGGSGADADSSAFDGGWGGEAGEGAHGDFGGDATGIQVMAEITIPMGPLSKLAGRAQQHGAGPDAGTAVVQGNVVIGIITGGAGGAAGRGGDGGRGGRGATTTSGLPGAYGGSGGWGGPAGKGGDGGQGGVSTGIRSDFDLIQNEVRAVITAGAGGAAGYGGDGGPGGDGGDGEDHAMEAGAGGFGGYGGAGGDAGGAGRTGPATGIIASGGASLFQNRVMTVRGDAPPGPGGQGGSGGRGGHGGQGGDAGPSGEGGHGGFGGRGGPGGSGGKGSDGGWAVGLVVDPTLAMRATAENNQVSHIFGGSGTAGGNGGPGGPGGDGRSGGTGGTPGDGGTGGDGGNGGDGNKGGSEGEAVGLDAFAGPIALTHNSIAIVASGLAGGGGQGGAGGTGGLHAQGGSARPGLAGNPGATGPSAPTWGIFLDFSNRHLAQGNLDTTIAYTVVNNIVADLDLGLQQALAAVSPTVGIGGFLPVTATLDYNDVYGWDEAYKNVTAGAHDISVDPLFVDINAADLHLTAYSPCIDRGTSNFPGLALPRVDIDGDSRPQRTSHDMGADEYLQRAYVPVVLRNFP